MRILAIETSCDESAVAAIEVSGSRAKPRLRVLSNAVASQVKLHAKFGGVVPHLAKREHQKNLLPILHAALKDIGGPRRSRIAWSDRHARTLEAILEREPELLGHMLRRRDILLPPPVDVVAVTVGPGLAPALWVGVNFARALAYLWDKPMIAVNHLEGHIYTNLLPEVGNVKRLKTKDKSSSVVPSSFDLRPLAFPALCLIVSGGHTELALMPGHGRYRVIGETRDDAAGEAFDKVAKMMRLGFPGGPLIQRFAETGDPRAFDFPRPMIAAASFDFSFSGLKTAVLYAIRGLGRLTPKSKRDIAASFQRAVVDVLVAKTIRAARQYRVRTVLVGGGVAANAKLREELGGALRRTLPGVRYVLPDVRLTGDNALMVALAAYFHRNRKTSWRGLQADANLRLDSRASAH